MDLHELRAIVEAERSAALGSSTSHGSGRNKDADLPAQRATNMNFYLGDMQAEMPAPEGRSAVVSTDVADTVDSVLPALMDIFTGTDEVVAFKAIGPEDEEAATQETDYVNHVFYVDNDGFVVLHTMMKDALIQKNGVCKFWWDEDEETERESYRALPDDAFALLMQDETIELIEHTEVESPYGTLHDAVVVKRKEYGCVKVMAVPPEEFVIARDARTIAEARYCAHKVKRTASQLVEMGYSQKVIDEIPSGHEVPTFEAEARSTVGDDEEFREASVGVNKAMREIEVWEHYVRVDFDGDGIAELRKVTQAGSKILDNEEFDRMPFASITPILMSHRFVGRCPADLVIEIQKIKTAVQRGILDNFYFMNNQRVEIAESHATENTLDDYLTNRPGSPIRTKQPGGIVPIPTAPIGPAAFPLLEYFDQVRETRTGVQRYAAGPDANTLNPFNSTATGANIVATAAQQRIRLMARVFAEGLKEMFLGIHELILKHGTDARKVKLRNKWVTVDPRQWKTRKDLNVMVGLGTGTRDQQQAFLMQILNTQVKAIELQGGIGGPIVDANGVHHTLKKLVENAGFSSADQFFKEPPPEASQPQPPPPDPKMLEVQAKMQLEQVKFEFEKAMAVEKNAMEREQMRADYELKVAELQAEIALAQQKANVDVELKKQDQAVKHELAAQDTASKAEERRKPAVAIEGFDARMGAAEQNIGAKLDSLNGGLEAMGRGLSDLARAIAAPRKLVRGADGRAAGVEAVLQ